LSCTTYGLGAIEQIKDMTKKNKTIVVITWSVLAANKNHVDVQNGIL